MTTPDHPNTQHGHRCKRFTSPTWHSWRGMNKRCYAPRNIDYARYGGRGIVVCDRWRNSFIHFLADMGERPLGTSLDRRDVNGNYDPENCRWATSAEQSVNKRHSKYLTLGDATKPLIAWAKDLGVPPATLWDRLERGWSIEETVTIPPGQRPLHKKTHCLKGHRFDDANTLICINKGKSVRRCRQCYTAYQKEYRTGHHPHTHDGCAGYAWQALAIAQEVR